MILPAAPLACKTASAPYATCSARWPRTDRSARRFVLGLPPGRRRPLPQGDRERHQVAEALRICTLHGAYASFEETIKGSIMEGKLAGFVLLADDPNQTDPERIKDIKVVRTVVGGRTVYPKEG
ncbi:MAG TPA: amidohydrolase family protein [Gemmataceae bacterium]|nr:amidohydrolase family protein [Gemmataceae bacterium]